jgi:hypothetical protein
MSVICQLLTWYQNVHSQVLSCFFNFPKLHLNKSYILFKIFSCTDFQDTALSDSHVAPTSQVLAPIEMQLLMTELPVKWKRFQWHLVHTGFHENECICVWNIGAKNEAKPYFVGSYKLKSEFKRFYFSVFHNLGQFPFYECWISPIHWFCLCILQIRFNLEASIGFHCMLGMFK